MTTANDFDFPDSGFPDPDYGPDGTGDTIAFIILLALTFVSGYALGEGQVPAFTFTGLAATMGWWWMIEKNSADEDE